MSHGQSRIYVFMLVSTQNKYEYEYDGDPLLPTPSLQYELSC